MSIADVTVYDGKYTFQCPPGNWKITILRYGEPWMEIEKGHRAVLALMDEINELRARVATYETAIAEQNRK